MNENRKICTRPTHHCLRNKCCKNWPQNCY